MATTNLLAPPARLSDAEILAEVPRLAAREREATVALIAHLAELDARRLYRAEGCSSLFTYCTQVLRLSEHAAYGRIEAARAVRRYPVVLERLAEGSVTLTTVTLLAPHLTAENHRDLLEQARHKSRREVEALVASLRPHPPVPASVRRLPTPRPERPTVPTTAAAPAVSPPAPLIPDEATRAAPLSPLAGDEAPSPPVHAPPHRRLRGRRSSPPWRPSATRSSSPPAPRRTRSCGWRRTSCATRSPTATSGRSSTAP